MPNARIVPLLLAAVLPAQDNPLTEATADLLARATPLLASDTAKDVAWGAHLAARFELKDAAMPLRDALRKWRNADGDAARQVRLHLVDALWATHAELPVDDYAFLLDDLLTRVPAFLIAARSPLDNRDLLARLATRSLHDRDHVPLAAGGLLVDHDAKAPDFARHLLSVAEVEMMVTVIDHDKRDGEWNSATFPRPASRTMLPVRGFPRLPWHTLVVQHHGIGTTDGTAIRHGRESDTKLPNEVALPAEGRDADPAIVHKRELVSGIKQVLVTKLDKEPRAPSKWQALLWLERMSGMPLQRVVSMELRWRDAASFIAEVAAARGELAERLKPLAEKLIAKEWLPRDAGSLELRIDVRIFDQRGDTTVKLPEIPAR